jgi:vacuolar-type H+-ATPase subunit H
MKKVDAEIRGDEINISCLIYKKKEKPTDEFIKELEEELENLASDSSAYLLDDFVFEDRELEEEMEMDFEEKYNNYLNLKDDEFAIVYYYIYNDSLYSIDNIDLDDKKTITLEHSSICNYNLLKTIKQKDNDEIRLDFLDSSGDAYTEAFIVDKNNCIDISANSDKIIETLKERNFI